MADEVSGQVMITGERIFLRRFQMADFSVLYQWGQNRRYHDLAGFQKIPTIQAAEKAASQYAKRNNSWAICLKDDSQKVIGLIELYERGLDQRSGLLETKELGFLLSKEYEGNGYMTEAMKLVMQEAFIKQRQKELWAGCFTKNLHCQTFLEKLGFEYCYTTDYSTISNIFSYQEKYYLLKRSEWLKIYPNAKS